MNLEKPMGCRQFLAYIKIDERLVRLRFRFRLIGTMASCRPVQNISRRMLSP